MAKPYLIFDAGGTLVFPDFKYLADIILASGYYVTQDELFNIHCELIYQLDTQTHREKYLIDPFPSGYSEALCKGVIEDPTERKIINSIVSKRDQEKAIWTSSYPWVAETLEKLKTAGFSMSVISNSDGRASQILEELNLVPFFDQIFDSTIVGFSKPDSRLFKHALKNLDIQSKDAIYIGDVFYIDVWGSNQAGIRCIHLDPKSLYKEWPGVRLSSIMDVENFLIKYCENPEKYDLFPARDISISY